MDANELFSEDQKKSIEAFEELIDDFNSSLNDIQNEIIELRKKGFDVLVAHLMLRSIKSKMLYVRKTQSQEELNKVKLEVNELLAEIEEVKKQKILDVKQELKEELKKEGFDFLE